MTDVAGRNSGRMRDARGGNGIAEEHDLGTKVPILSTIGEIVSYSAKAAIEPQNPWSIIISYYPGAVMDGGEKMANSFVVAVSVVVFVEVLPFYGVRGVQVKKGSRWKLRSEFSKKFSGIDVIEANTGSVAGYAGYPGDEVYLVEPSI